MAAIDVARESYNFWISKGCTDFQALAWIGMQAGETSFLIHAIGDHGEAYGNFQDHMDRVLEIKKGTGIDVRTASNLDQCAGAYWECTKGWFKNVWPALLATETLWSAVSVLVRDFEKSANQDSDIVKRVALALFWKTKLGV